MRDHYFYYGTTKSIIAAFGILFSNIKFQSDFGELITVPLHYSAKESFLEITQNDYNYFLNLDMNVAYPRMGFELVTMMYDPQRMLNPLSKVLDKNESLNSYMFNRVPYNFGFNLYITSIKFEDSLKIIEQIIPFFTPEFNISIRDKEDFNLITDIPFIINDVSFELGWNRPSYTERANILWTINFTAKAWLYSNVREKTRIKETIINMTDLDFARVYETLTSEVVPRSADQKDQHSIISVVDDLEANRLYVHFRTGEEVSDFMFEEDVNYYYLLPLDDTDGIGEIMSVELIISKGPVKFIYPKFYTGENVVVDGLDEIPFNLMPYQGKAKSGENLDVNLQIIPGFMPHIEIGEEIRNLIVFVHKPFY